MALRKYPFLLAVVMIFLAIVCVEGRAARGHPTEYDFSNNKCRVSKKKRTKDSVMQRRTRGREKALGDIASTALGSRKLIVKNSTDYSVLVSGALSSATGSSGDASFSTTFKPNEKGTYTSKGLLIGSKGSSLLMSFLRGGNVVFRKTVRFNGKTAQEKIGDVAVTRRWVDGQGWMLIVK